MSDSPQATESVSSQSPPNDLLLVVFIHGFKGTDETFAQFPGRLQHVLSETVSSVVVESTVFPQYETKGELTAAVIRFADWLTNLTVEREVQHGVGGGAGKAKIVLCGHSMGGLLAADVLIEFVRTRPDQFAPLWPNIIACLAFDTPYFGVHPFVFKNSAAQAAGYVRSAKEVFTGFQSFTSKSASTSVPAGPPIAAPPTAQTSISTSGWSKWAPAAYTIGGALLAGAAAGTAYYKREDLGFGYKWVTDHMRYVGTLWDDATLQRRVDRLVELEQEMGVVFRTFYTYLPPSPPAHPSARTFIVQPRSPRHADHFIRAPNSLAADEIQAHVGMFGSKTNDGYYELGLITAQFIRDALNASRARVDEGADPAHLTEAAHGS
ncbi:hypothetical protein OBBRIDRAFT_791568 [Obba rivulosa]|uniref:DUF676 domain-containing protein n=1 Tax=Obba rivulosa TaxID=1052685 RepID=A0A8E2B200_9APHY|nr:hypothetical protein OBBRIDRAFT_791568 [Obba rivulosa]